MRFVGTALVAGTIGVFFLLADGGWTRAGMEGSTNSAAGSERTAKFAQPGHFNQVIGRTVENVDGEKLGTIKDLILQRKTGEIQYVLVRSAGFIGHRRMAVVPVSAIALTTAKAGIASIDISKRDWKKAPEFRKENLALLAKPVCAEAVARFYEKAEGAPRHPQNPGMQGPQLSSTGREQAKANWRSRNDELELASDLVGKN
jgi:sporulation protein YlmC with PRC-barrel domain